MMIRLRLCGIWALCALVTPLLIVMMLGQALFGSTVRAHSMAIALDECGNALLGGEARETISKRTGLALIAGKRWARIAAPCIDAIFGDNHCLNAAKGD